MHKISWGSQPSELWGLQPKWKVDKSHPSSLALTGLLQTWKTNIRYNILDFLCTWIDKGDASLTFQQVVQNSVFSFGQIFLRTCYLDLSGKICTFYNKHLNKKKLSCYTNTDEIFSVLISKWSVMNIVNLHVIPDLSEVEENNVKTSCNKMYCVIFFNLEG